MWDYSRAFLAATWHWGPSINDVNKKFGISYPLLHPLTLAIMGLIQRVHGLYIRRFQGFDKFVAARLSPQHSRNLGTTLESNPVVSTQPPLPLAPLSGTHIWKPLYHVH